MRGDASQGWRRPDEPANRMGRQKEYKEIQMLNRVKAFVVAVPLGLALLGTVNAGWHGFWNRVHLDFHRNNSWPQPFVSADRQAVCAPFNAMVQSGWRTQNTLGTHYFNSETQSLNEAGERRLHAIITNAPDEYRTVFVAATHEPEAVERRVDSVQQALARMLPQQPLPPVLATSREPVTWPAANIDAINLRSQSTIPSPRLPDFQSAGGPDSGQ